MKLISIISVYFIKPLWDITINVPYKDRYQSANSALMAIILNIITRWRNLYFQDRSARKYSNDRFGFIRWEGGGGVDVEHCPRARIPYNSGYFFAFTAFTRGKSGWKSWVYGRRQWVGAGRQSAHIGGGGEGKKRGYCVVYTRASRGVCRLPQRKVKLLQSKMKKLPQR